MTDQLPIDDMKAQLKAELANWDDNTPLTMLVLD